MPITRDCAARIARPRFHPASAEWCCVRVAFVTDFYEETTNDVTSQKFIRVERPRIQLNGESIALPDQHCGFVRFGHDGSVFHHSSGEHEKGYAVCMTCGRAESMLASGEMPRICNPIKRTARLADWPAAARSATVRAKRSRPICIWATRSVPMCWRSSSGVHSQVNGFPTLPRAV